MIAHEREFLKVYEKVEQLMCVAGISGGVKLVVQLRFQ